MTKQLTMTYTTTDGKVMVIPVRGKHYVQPRGYAYHPGTGPKDQICGTCKHCLRFRRWAKCDKARAIWTGGRGSDILVKSPACKYWEKAE